MKRYITFALVMLIALPSVAMEKKSKCLDSPYKSEITVSWGMLPYNEALGYSTFFTNYQGGLDNIYNNYMTGAKTSGLISIDYNIRFTKRFALGIQANTSFFKQTEMSSISGTSVGTYFNYSLSALAYARLTYMRWKWAELYGTFGLGLNYVHTEDPQEIHILYPHSGLTVAYQCAPIGLTVGKRFYGFAEYGYGSEYMGMRFGIGYRF